MDAESGPDNPIGEELLAINREIEVVIGRIREAAESGIFADNQVSNLVDLVAQAVVCGERMGMPRTEALAYLWDEDGNEKASA